MNELLAWLVERIQEDEYLNGALARSSLDPSVCGVYTTPLVPPGSQLPYVVILGPNGGEPDRNFDSTYRRPSFDLHVYYPRPADGGGSIAGVNEAAERLFQLFDAFHGPLGGEDVLSLSCGEPIVNDGEAAFGRVIPLRCLMAAVA